MIFRGDIMYQVFEVFSKASLFVPIMIGLAKIAQMIFLPRKWTPVWNLVIGLIISFLYIYPYELKTTLLVGVMLGLSASGLYSGVKSTTQAIREMK